MKTLHLLRHAKSSWKDNSLSDRDRGLNKRGARDAPRMGEALSQILDPMPIVASPARRAQLTLQGLVQGWSGLGEQQHRTEEALYTFSWEDVCAWIAGRAEECSALFLIGHNPAFTDLVNELLAEHCLHNLPTAGYARLSLEIDRWGDLLHGDAFLEQTLFPRQLPGVQTRR